MKIELNEKEVGRITENLLILQDLVVEESIPVPTLYSHIFGEYPESKHFDEYGEFTDEEEKSMLKEIDSFLSKNQLIIKKLLKNG